MRKIRKAFSGIESKVNKPEYRYLALESLEQRVLLNGAVYDSPEDRDWPAAASDMGQTMLPALDLVKFTLLSENGNFEVSDVATDSEGNIYVAGTAGHYSGKDAIGKGGFKQLIQSHSGRDDGFVAKYSADGVAQWLTFIGGSNDDSIAQISVDSSGIWISGGTYSYASNSTTVFPGYENVAYGGSFVAGLTTNGAWRWTSSVSENILNSGGSTSYSIGSYSSSFGGPLVSFPGNGTAYALVSVYDESKGDGNEESIAVATISSSGALSVVSDFSYDFHDLPGRTVERSVIVSPDKVISIINATGGVNSYDLMILTPDSVSMVRGFDGVVRDHDTDSQGNLIVAGYLSSNSNDGFVAKHQSDGGLAWQVEMGGSGQDLCMAVAGDDSGNVYFAGTSYSPDDFPFVNSFEQPESYYFPFYGQIDSDGEVLWNTAVGKSGDQWIGAASDSGLAVSEGSVVFAWSDHDNDSHDPIFGVGRISTEAGEDLPTASLVSDYVVGGQALVTDMNSARYIDVKFADTRNASVNGDEISLDGEGAEGVTLKGKPKLVDKQENIWRFVVDGAFTAGPVVLNYLSNTFTNDDGQPNSSASETFYAIPDIAPLAFSVESSEFSWNELASRYEYEGGYSIGMKPAAGSSYQGLINVSSGSLSFDKTRIYGQGTVSTAITGANLNLFSGDFEIVIGQSKTDILVESGVSLAAAWELAGCDYQFTSLTLAEGKVQTQGNVHMPTEFGSVELAVSGDQAIVMDATGISLTGSTLTLPSVELDLPWLKMNAESLSIEYIA
ncbi:MAG: SBBP repeat-containing protein, partial [Sedimentisphaerales bacterium]|nr:SBBP repeat-containing protein [Sedimentisphaerales bacterium]